jgi:hypothetical protein
MPGLLRQTTRLTFGESIARNPITTPQEGRMTVRRYFHSDCAQAMSIQSTVFQFHRIWKYQEVPVVRQGQQGIA